MNFQKKPEDVQGEVPVDVRFRRISASGQDIVSVLDGRYVVSVPALHGFTRDEGNQGLKH